MTDRKWQGGISSLRLGEESDVQDAKSCQQDSSDLAWSEAFFKKDDRQKDCKNNATTEAAPNAVEKRQNNTNHNLHSNDWVLLKLQPNWTESPQMYDESQS